MPIRRLAAQIRTNFAPAGRQAGNRNRQPAAAIAGRARLLRRSAPTAMSWFNRPMRIPPSAFLPLVAMLAGLSAEVPAKQPQPPVRRVVESFLHQQVDGLAGDVSVEVEDIDPLNHLPACDRLAAFMPNGRRAWGRTSVGVRCAAPVEWTIYVAATVRVIGEYLVLARPLRPGQIVSPDDLETRRGDLTSDGAGALIDSTQAVGYPARIAVSAGQPLKREMLRLPPVVRRGQQVRVVTTGQGFTVANEGHALNDAAAGQVVRVRLASGKVLSGTAGEDGAVRIAP